MATPEEMAAKMIANLPEKTGKSLDEWLKLVSDSKLEKHGAIVKFLKADHGMTHGFANLVAHTALKSAASTAEPGTDLVGDQYAGPKATLRPIYDAIIQFLGTLGADVEIAPKKASVSLRRSKQFALVTPATKTRVDLGINIKGKDPEGRLEASKKNAMCTHVVKLTTLNDFDDEVKDWLKEAYSKA